MKTTVIIGDVHLEHDKAPHKSYLLVKQFVSSIKPDHLIINGDWLDCSYLSKYTAEAPRLTEGKRLVKDRDLAVNELTSFAKVCKKITYLEGNHEFRIQKTLDSSPVYEGLIELPNLLTLDELKIEWVPESKQPYKINETTYVLHGKRLGKYYASQMIDDYVGVNVIQNHTHRPMTFAKSNNLTGQVYQGIGAGCLCDLHQSYENGRPTGHSNGFVVIQEERGVRTITNIIIENNSFIFGGKIFSN